MFDAIKGATGLYLGQKQIRSQLRVMKANPQVTRATNAVLNTAGVAHVVADATIFPVARAAATIASEYIEETSTQDGVVGAAAYVCVVGIHGIVDVATKVQIAMQPDPNSVQIRGQRDQQCDTKMVEMFDYELDQIDERTTMEDFGKKPSAGVSDDGLEDVDLYQGGIPNINVDTRNTAKCTLDPYDDWELIDSDDETDERTEEFQNERLADSDGSLSHQQQTKSYNDSDLRQNMDSYSARNARLFDMSALAAGQERGRQLKRHGSPESFINSSGAKIHGLRRCDDTTSGITAPIEDSTTSDEELDPEIERLVIEMKWRQAESTRAERGESVRRVGDILDNTEFQPSITFMQADLDAARRVCDSELAMERAKDEVAEAIVNNMPEQTQEVKETPVGHVKTRALETLTRARRYVVSGSKDVIAPVEVRSQPIAIPGAIARKPVRHPVKKSSAMDTIFDDESVGSEASDGDDDITLDDSGVTSESLIATKDNSRATVFTFRAAGLPLTTTKAGTAVAGKVSSASFEQAAANFETACYHREWQLCACGKKEKHAHVREDEDGELEV